MPMDMMTIAVAELRIGSALDEAPQPLACGKAELVLVVDYGDLLWYITVEQPADDTLLRRYGSSDNIRVAVRVITGEGSHLDGIGYFHANEQNGSAVIRGDGVLNGLPTGATSD